MSTQYSLFQLGWKTFFQQQLSLSELENHFIGRVSGVHKSHLDLLMEQGKRLIAYPKHLDTLTVGDWLVLDKENKPIRSLERLSLFSRKSAGKQSSEQLIAANIDTVMIVCSLNEDFNLNRIERYLALTQQSGAEAVVILSKADLCPDYEDKRYAVEKLNPFLPVFALNTLSTDVEQLTPWCKAGQTLTVVGSSGVGKSSLVNSLIGNGVQTTQAIRENDGKGKHTTTARSLHLLPQGGVILDTPGMREIQILADKENIEEVFTEIHQLANKCKFSDCKHENEPGCAVLEQVATGQIDARRLENYRKLIHEAEFNSISIAEKRAKEKSLSKFYHNTMIDSYKIKRGE
ncbi:ribosome small subunit-dependent GTPase A [Teredinibacter sp. KSP-S5-2]|uniref:ribosome small subunit-dependent GTPase A n=1 Tax=Teredinibacter sp. KSP-S5-2 TaxID=3034506 RepID=UPI002934D0C6|nr:ribosome small subunit-dependent GTPase A [Teredinibacter sp. KSP-S5-2]WNO08786.1 ribosome small subunit-dependent GTPase A [Teredinibacter sp. KSP-S5-2]